MKGRAKAVLCLAFLLAGPCAMNVRASQEGEWALSDDGKYWMYYYSPSETAENEWIEEDRKTYYVDSQGRMKTGWVRRDSDGRRYYMGPDGAMQCNCFAEDGRYVGPDGSELPAYDSFRKKAKKTLGDASEYAKDGTAGFLIQDLNDDGYPDLVIADGTGAEAQPLLLAVWDPESGDFIDSARFEQDAADRRAFLYLGDEWYPTRLEIVWAEGDVQVFELDGLVFETEWNLTTRPDAWGGREFLKDGIELSREDWNNERLEALSEEKGQKPYGYLPVDEVSIASAVDRILTEDEADLWEQQS